MKFGWKRFRSVFHFSTIFNHEAEHARRSYIRKYVRTEAAPFMGYRDYAVLYWSGEEEAYRAQSTGLLEIADAATDLERCRAEILNGIPGDPNAPGDEVLERLAAGKEGEAREKIVDVHPAAATVAEWQQYANVTSEERDKLVDVEAKVRALLATPEWRVLVDRWEFALP
jgi:hypothetical protein